jgi:hypothetical protein
MSDKTKLEELSAELPEKERKELLDKITKRLAPQRNEEVMRVELNQEEKQRLVNEEMRHISGWGRFLLWLRHLLSGRSKRELFLYHKLGQLKRAIKQRTPGLTGFETRDLTPKFARQVYELYATAYPLKDFFRLFSQEQDFLDKSIAELVEAKYDESVKSLEDLLPLSEMEDIYAGSGYEEAVKKQLLRRFNEYVRKIPDRLFAQIEEGLKPFIYLKNLVLFPYADIFRHFSYFLPEQLEEANPHFNHGPAMLMLERLERFYFAIFLVLKLPKEWYCHPEILKSYALHSRELEDTDELDEQEISQEVIELTEALKTFIEHVRQFSTRIPLMDLIRYFRKDPYYRLVFNVPSFYIKAIYTAAIKRRVLEDFDDAIIEVKKNVVNRKIRNIFKTDNLLELFYYNDTPNFDFRKLGLPYFTHTKSLMLLYNYLSKVYKGHIQEVVQTASAYILANNRIVQSRLMQCAANLEELEAKIVLFDRSLAPDEDDGKALTRYRHHIGNDLSQQRLYRNFVAEKDKEAKDLFDRGEENLGGIKKIFDEIITSPMESVKSILKTLHFHRGKNQTLLGLIRSTSDIIADFSGVMDQLEVLEKGA